MTCSAEELCQIFDTIASLFHGFGTNVVTTPDSHGGRLLYVLRSLSTVRSSVLMVWVVLITKCYD
jgi:energy-converting hydrogenase Eha subunit F